MNNLLSKIKSLTEKHEMFLFESPNNHYQPKPPKVWFALRSDRRRIFMGLKDGKIPTPDEINVSLIKEEYITSSL